MEKRGASTRLAEYKNYGGMVGGEYGTFPRCEYGAILQVDRRDWEMYHSSIDLFNYAVRSSRAIPLWEESGDLHYYQSTVSGRAYKFNILNELANTGNESTNRPKRNCQFECEFVQGIKIRGVV